MSLQFGRNSHLELSLREAADGMRPFLEISCCRGLKGMSGSIHSCENHLHKVPSVIGLDLQSSSVEVVDRDALWMDLFDQDTPRLELYCTMSAPLKFERNPRYILNPTSETSLVV